MSGTFHKSVVSTFSPLASLAQVVLSVNVINPNVPAPTPVVVSSGKTSGGGGGGGSGSPMASSLGVVAVAPVSHTSVLPQTPSVVPASSVPVTGSSVATVASTAVPVPAVTAATGPQALLPLPLSANITLPIAEAVFKKTLAQGQSGTDVQLLQRFLNTHGSPVTLSGKGSLGKEQGTFGSLTKAALLKYQRANSAGILGTNTPQVFTGTFGPLTKAYILKVIASGK